MREDKRMNTFNQSRISRTIGLLIRLGVTCYAGPQTMAQISISPANILMLTSTFGHPSTLTRGWSTFGVGRIADTCMAGGQPRQPYENQRLSHCERNASSFTDHAFAQRQRGRTLAKATLACLSWRDLGGGLLCS